MPLAMAMVRMHTTVTVPPLLETRLFPTRFSKEENSQVLNKHTTGAII